MKKNILVLLMFVFLIGCFSLAKGELQFEDLTANKENKIEQEIYEYICKDSLSMSPPASCYPKITKMIDLNGDGVEEIFVSGQDVLLYQGSRSYTTWLFTIKNNQLTELKNFLGYDVDVLDTKTNGYFDLKQGYWGGFTEDRNFLTSTYYFKWDKAENNYIKTVSLSFISHAATTDDYATCSLVYGALFQAAKNAQHLGMLIYSRPRLEAVIPFMREKKDNPIAKQKLSETATRLEEEAKNTFVKNVTNAIIEEDLEKLKASMSRVFQCDKIFGLSTLPLPIKGESE